MTATCHPHALAPLPLRIASAGPGPVSPSRVGALCSHLLIGTADGCSDEGALRRREELPLLAARHRRPVPAGSAKHRLSETSQDRRVSRIVFQLSRQPVKAGGSVLLKPLVADHLHHVSPRLRAPCRGLNNG